MTNHYINLSIGNLELTAVHCNNIITQLITPFVNKMTPPLCLFQCFEFFLWFGADWYNFNELFVKCFTSLPFLFLNQKLTFLNLQILDSLPNSVPENKENVDLKTNVLRLLKWKTEFSAKDLRTATKNKNGFRRIEGEKLEAVFNYFSSLGIGSVSTLTSQGNNKTTKIFKMLSYSDLMKTPGCAFTFYEVLGLTKDCLPRTEIVQSSQPILTKCRRTL